MRPNLGFTSKRTLVAIKDIESGDELTFDYAMCTSDAYYLICECGSKNCRKVVTGNDWQNKKLQKKYKEYLSPYIQEKIKKLTPPL